jgi:hypothetical protein
VAFRAKDGRAFGNRQKQRAYDQRSSVKSDPKGQASGESAGEAQRERPAAGESYTTDPPFDENDVSDSAISDVVQRHGPAMSITISHDHENGSHRVMTRHGKVSHNSTHPNADAAHSHAAAAAGLGPGSQQAASAGFQGEEAPDRPIPGYGGPPRL